MLDERFSLIGLIKTQAPRMMQGDLLHYNPISHQAPVIADNEK